MYIPFMVQIGMYITPIAYPRTLIPERFQWLYHLNPMAGIVSGFRWSFLGQVQLSVLDYVSFGITIVLFVTGIFYFKKVERTMADLV